MSHLCDLIELFCVDPAPLVSSNILPDESSSPFYNSSIEDPLFDELLWDLNTFPALAFPILRPKIKHHPICQYTCDPPFAKKRRLSEPPLALAPPGLRQAPSLRFSNLTRDMDTRGERFIRKRSRFRWKATEAVEDAPSFFRKEEERERELDGFSFLRALSFSPQIR